MSGSILALLHGPVGIEGVPEGEPSPVWLVPAYPLDAPIIAGPVSKDQREDLQILSFMQALGMTGGHHPMEVLTPSSDPPDRVLSAGGTRWAVEMTELTAFDVRHELAVARAIGRSLQEHLRASDKFDHLRGRRVVASFMPEAAAKWPEHSRETIETLAAMLETDRGWVGKGVDAGHAAAEGLPQHLPREATGVYGTHGAVVVQVYPDGLPGEIVALATSQAQISRESVIRVLQERINAKDHSPNELLLVTCGLVDNRGYTCPLDGFIFQALREELSSGALALSISHLSSIALHLWGTAEWLPLHQADAAPAPWG